MINFPPTIPVGSTAHTIKKTPTQRIAPSSATDKRETRLDRRRMSDRRSRRGSKQVMDRRYGLERRRSSIDLSV